jgi:prolyl oligopeptidase
VLFTLFESDTRVDPLHGRKMCAALQHATTASIEERPIIVRRERDVGHFARSVGRTIDLAVDVLSFQAAQLGLQLPD